MLLSNPRLVLALFFLGGGIGIGTWASCLPLLASGFELDERQIGIILLCFALGAITSMTVVGRVVDRKGARAVAWVSTALFGLLILLIPHAGSLILFGAFVAATGASFGCLDVSMNTAASELERVRDQRIMSSFHAAFSVGNFVGAVVCGQVLRSGGDVRICFTISGLLIVAMGLAAAWSSGVGKERSVAADAGVRGSGATPVRRSRMVLLLGGMAFLVFFAEGAILDWIALLLVQRNQFEPEAAAYGFAVFAGAMALGRAIGDKVIDRFGAVAVVRMGMIGVAASFSLILFAAPTPVIYVCLAVSGLGIANVIPCIFSAAGRQGSHAAGAAMSRVTSMGYSGLLVGPAVVGFTAHQTNLPTGLGIVVVFSMILVASASIIRRVSLAESSV